MTHPRFEELVAASVGGQVSAGVMFGGRGLRTGKRFYAVWWGDRLIVKLPEERIEELTVAGHGREYVPDGRRVMKEWAELDDSADWTAVCAEARAHVEAG